MKWPKSLTYLWRRERKGTKTSLAFPFIFQLKYHYGPPFLCLSFQDKQLNKKIKKRRRRRRRIKERVWPQTQTLGGWKMRPAQGRDFRSRRRPLAGCTRGDGPRSQITTLTGGQKTHKNTHTQPKLILSHRYGKRVVLSHALRWYFTATCTHTQCKKMA